MKLAVFITVILPALITADSGNMQFCGCTCDFDSTDAGCAWLGECSAVKESGLPNNNACDSKVAQDAFDAWVKSKDDGTCVLSKCTGTFTDVPPTESPTHAPTDSPTPPTPPPTNPPLPANCRGGDVCAALANATHPVCTDACKTWYCGLQSLECKVWEVEVHYKLPDGRIVDVDMVDAGAEVCGCKNWHVPHDDHLALYIALGVGGALVIGYFFWVGYTKDGNKDARGNVCCGACGDENAWWWSEQGLYFWGFCVPVKILAEHFSRPD